MESLAGRRAEEAAELRGRGATEAGQERAEAGPRLAAGCADDPTHERTERRTEAERAAAERAKLMDALAAAAMPWWRRWVGR